MSTKPSKEKKVYSAHQHLSMIIPLFADDARGAESLRRLETLLSDCRRHVHEIVVGDASRTRHEAIKTLCATHGAVHVHCPQAASEPFAPGQARDAAVARATGEFLLLYDVDLMPTPDFFPQLSKHYALLAREKNRFVMIPCLYLDRQGTMQVQRGRVSIRDFWLQYLRGDFRGIVNLAVASSLLLLRRDHYLEVGGHRKAFIGHGGEDLEFIHRLVKAWPRYAWPEDYAQDVPQAVIAESRGFRRLFTYYGLEHPFTGLLAAHAWHPRPLTSPYMQAERGNKKRLSEYLKAVAAGDLPEPPPLAQFIADLMNKYGYAPDRYSGFFKDQFASKTFSERLRRKTRKLLRDPKRFFADLRAA